MQSDGPYSTGDSVGLVFKYNREVESFDSERDKLNACRLANAAYAEGRKAERERCLEIIGDFHVCGWAVIGKELENRIRGGAG